MPPAANKKQANQATKATIAGLPKPPSPETAQPTAGQKEKEEVRQTLYLPNSVHQQLRKMAYDNNVSQQELFRRALNLLFKDATMPLWEDLVPAKDQKV